MNGLLRKTTMTSLLVCAIFLGGCAFGTRHPTLTYPPEHETGKTSVAYAAVEAADRPVPIVLKPFADQRADKAVVGTVRNAYGMRTADVVPTNDVAAWVTEAVRTELLENGYSVANRALDEGPAKTSLVVSGEILNVFCDMYFSYSGQVSMVIRVNNEKQELLNKHYAGEGSAGLAFAMTSESYAQSLALALASALSKFIADLGAIASANE